VPLPAATSSVGVGGRSPTSPVALALQFEGAGEAVETLRILAEEGFVEIPLDGLFEVIGCRTSGTPSKP
jgi:hypothetical protein